MGILETIIHTKQNENLNQFKPGEIVGEILSMLKDRDKQILLHRYGLQGRETKTLAAIGGDQNLTRERVRQIEKDLIKNLRKAGPQNKDFTSTKDFLLSIVADHGRIIAEENLLLYLNIKDKENQNAIIFILHLIEELEHFIQENYKKAWITVLFNEKLMHEFVDQSKQILQERKSPLETEEFLAHFKKTPFYLANQAELSDKVILN